MKRESATNLNKTGVLTLKLHELVCIYFCADVDLRKMMWTVYSSVNFKYHYVNTYCKPVANKTDFFQ